MIDIGVNLTSSQFNDVSTVLSNAKENNVKKYLRPGIKILSRSIRCQTVESKIAKELEKIQKKYIKFVEIGSYPFFRLGKIGVSIVLRSSKKNNLQSCHKDIIKFLKNKKIKIYKGM